MYVCKCIFYIYIYIFTCFLVLNTKIFRVVSFQQMPLLFPFICFISYKSYCGKEIKKIVIKFVLISSLNSEL